MLQSFTPKRILLGISGGIAAYKTVELVRLLKKQGAEVKVVMTQAAEAFVTGLTLQAVSGQPVHKELLSTDAEAGMGHIELARWADFIILAPASADLIAKLACGLADDLLTTLCLASEAPLALAPAMNQAMWRKAVTQRNVADLQARGALIFGPAEGEQACGDVGPGRMLEPIELLDCINHALVKQRQSHLANKKVVITAGPTQEAIDPVRYISNHSSGKMGYALAEVARDYAANVVLISGPTHLAAVSGVQQIAVTSAEEMARAVMAELSDTDIFMAAAAVADFRVADPQSCKIKKQGNELNLRLIPNPDILAQVAASKARPLVIGFAAETDHLWQNAEKKIKAKKLDMLIANLVGEGQGFYVDDNQAIILQPNKPAIEYPLMSKRQLAEKIILLLESQVLGRSGDDGRKKSNVNQQKTKHQAK